MIILTVECILYAINNILKGVKDLYTNLVKMT